MKLISLFVLAVSFSAFAEVGTVKAAKTKGVGEVSSAYDQCMKDNDNCAPCQQQKCPQLMNGSEQKNLNNGFENNACKGDKCGIIRQ